MPNRQQRRQQVKQLPKKDKLVFKQFKAVLKKSAKLS